MLFLNVFYWQCAFFAFMQADLFTPKDTIRPGATGYFEGVRQAFETAVGGETVLRYPMKGGGALIFSVHDFDSDGTDE